MIHGAYNWNNQNIRYNQENRIIEKFLADLKAAKKLDFWLESCNVCACACSVEAVGASWKCNLPAINGNFILMQADLLFDYIYSSAYGKWSRDGVCENEMPEHLTAAIIAMSTAQAELHTYTTAEEAVIAMKEAVNIGHAAVFSYLTDYGGGHYIVAVAFDEDTDEFICYDSWAENKHCKNGGVKERYTTDFMKKRVRTRFIDVHKQEGKNE
jgi:hypothetical protein